MKEYITLCGREFEVVRSKLRKHVAVRVDQTGHWLIGAPAYYTGERLLNLLAGEKEMPALIARLEKKAAAIIPSAKEYEEGMELFFRGEVFPLRWVPGRASQPVELRCGAIRISEERKGMEAETLELWYSRQLYHMLRGILPSWTKRIGVAPKKISIKGVRSIWGSCSAKGSITFSSRLALVPRPLLEYVIAHELVHMKHMDHSDRFWRELEAYIPDYRERRDELKKGCARYNWR